MGEYTVIRSDFFLTRGRGLLFPTVLLPCVVTGRVRDVTVRHKGSLGHHLTWFLTGPHPVVKDPPINYYSKVDPSSVFLSPKESPVLVRPEVRGVDDTVQSPRSRGKLTDFSRAERWVVPVQQSPGAPPN